ncbi:transposase [Caenispirillum salinarum]|uniref:transposase n=1 Tax=Caenispirillum salinarum TaxID=859058 RepID=UPI0038517051
MSRQVLPKKTHRCDLLPHAMNGGKKAAVRELLRAWRSTARQVSSEQWQLFFEHGAFNRQAKIIYPDDPIGAARVQMVRYQVVGMLFSFIANRASEFRHTVEKSSLDRETKHQLHVINRIGAWFSRDPVTMTAASEPIADDIRRLARSIMRCVISRYRRPSMRRINAVIDQRSVAWGPAETATGFPLWATLKTMERQKAKDGKPSKAFQEIHVPLVPYRHHLERTGRRCLGLQVNEADDGNITFAIVTETTAAFADSREHYAPAVEMVSLDFGLRTMFATDDGDLFGRTWFETIKCYDAKITALARTAQKAGRKPRRDPAFKAAVTRLRGFVKTEIGRVLNRIVAVKKPRSLALERLNFRSPDLSRRMNRILQNCGRSVIRAKLQDLFERFGITADEVNPAYTSQECSACGYVDKRNRKQDTFKCLHCGHTAHADVDGARSVGSRRSRPTWQPHLTKAEVLDLLVTQFVKRHPGGRVSTGAGPWQTNPYFAKIRRAV